MILTKKQLDEFNCNGFLVLRKFVTINQCEKILDLAKVHLKHKIEPIETEIDYGIKSKEYRTNVRDYTSIHKKEGVTTVRRLRQVYERDVVFKAWMEDKKIQPILKQLLKDDVVLTTAHHNSIMTKMPFGSNETSWHQDRRYWSFSDDNLLSVWLALGLENEKNGVLEFIPGSHKMTFSAEQFGEKEYFKLNHSLNMSLIETKQSTTLEQGDVLLFHSRLLHRANANSTQTPKISFVYTVKGKRTKTEKGSRSDAYPEIIL